MAYFVVMKDAFMSGWGPATGKTNIYCVECPTMENAQLILKNAKTRDEMKNPRIVEKMPHYPSATHLVSRKHFNDLCGMWKE